MRHRTRSLYLSLAVSAVSALAVAGCGDHERLEQVLDTLQNPHASPEPPRGEPNPPAPTCAPPSAPASPNLRCRAVAPAPTAAATPPQESRAPMPAR